MMLMMCSLYLLLSNRFTIGAMAAERDQCSELRCKACLKLYSTASFADHYCQPLSKEELREFKRPKTKRDTHYNFFLHEFGELATSTPENPTYKLSFMVQDELGRVFGSFQPIQRTLSQIIGLAKTLAKSEKENALGRSAREMLTHLLDPQAKQSIRRVSL